MSVQKLNPDTIDLIKNWHGMKAAFFKVQGTYLKEDKTVAVISGYRSQPRVTYEQGRALEKAWLKTANNLFNTLNRKNKSTGALLDAIQTFQVRQIDWFTFVSDTYGVSNRNGFQGKWMFMPATDRLFQNLSHFISATHSAVNWSLNNEQTEWEILGEAIDETAGGSLIKPFYRMVEGGAAAYTLIKNAIDKVPDMFNDIGSGIEKLITIMKWGSIAGGLYLLFKTLDPKQGKK